MDDAEATAEFLDTLRSEGRTAEGLPADLMPADMPAAYRAQGALVRRLLERHGGRTAGYKIACTNEAAQRLLNAPGPVHARLLSAAVHASAAVLPTAGLLHLIVEPEFAFRVGKATPLDGPALDRESVVPYLDAALPAFEIVDHHFAAMDRFDARSLAADNGIHAAWVRGAPVSNWRGIDSAAQEVRLLVDGERVSTGSGALVLGHPLDAMAWLANALREQGIALRPGEYVTTGLCTDLCTPRPGQQLRAEFGPLGAVELRFEPA